MATTKEVEAHYGINMPEIRMQARPCSARRDGWSSSKVFFYSIEVKASGLALKVSIYI